MTDELLIGAHMSIAGGIHRACELGKQVGCSAIQIFLKNNTRWKGKVLTDEDRERFRDTLDDSPIRSVVAHNSYLINLGSPETALREKSLRALIEEMKRANFLGVPCVIMHPGSHMGRGERAGLVRIASAVNRALEMVPPPVRILLENTAGQGTALGCSFEQLAQIQDRIRKPERLGFCLDTCHLFAAGYDIRTEAGFRETMRGFNSCLGAGRLSAIHLNDSPRGIGSRIDRHTHIGLGEIGLEPFRILVNDKQFENIPKILETPKGEDLAQDIMNLKTLRSLVSKRRKRTKLRLR